MEESKFIEFSNNILSNLKRKKHIVKKKLENSVIPPHMKSCLPIETGQLSLNENENGNLENQNWESWATFIQDAKRFSLHKCCAENFNVILCGAGVLCTLTVNQEVTLDNMKQIINSNYLTNKSSQLFYGLFYQFGEVELISFSEVRKLEEKSKKYHKADGISSTKDPYIELLFLETTGHHGLIDHSRAG
ncbi:hypothetical protein F8M41_016111 [Gigaspora margarita]|uniref:Uncharacterized protein n=1 Tax=Gigaspora margarita TaxID=4874 RepID=A0A8H4APP2_GIGMA|nr:hypothetical protein F8M41_016111 [Gigaspora margarita]